MQWGRCCLHQYLLMDVEHPSSFPAPTFDLFLLRKGGGTVGGFMVTIGLCGVMGVALQRGWLYSGGGSALAARRAAPPPRFSQLSNESQ